MLPHVGRDATGIDDLPREVGEGRQGEGSPTGAHRALLQVECHLVTVLEGIDHLWRGEE